MDMFRLPSLVSFSWRAFFSSYVLRHHDACEANELNYRARSDKQHLTNFSFFSLFFYN